MIGVLESSAYFAGDVVTSHDTLDALAGRPLHPRPTTSTSVKAWTPRPWP